MVVVLACDRQEIREPRKEGAETCGTIPVARGQFRDDPALENLVVYENRTAPSECFDELRCECARRVLPGEIQKPGMLDRTACALDVASISSLAFCPRPYTWHVPIEAYF